MDLTLTQRMVPIVEDDSILLDPLETVQLSLQQCGLEVWLNNPNYWTEFDERYPESCFARERYIIEVAFLSQVKK